MKTLLCLGLLFSFFTFADQPPTLRSPFQLSAYKNNYLLFDSRIIFQFSFKINLLARKDTPPDGGGLFLGYTQHSYWKQGDGDTGNANPFIYSNYEPELFYRVKFTNGPLDRLQAGFDHISDGLGRQFDSQHREWNRVYIEPRFYFLSRHLLWSERIWYADDRMRYNSNIADFLGYTETHLETDYLTSLWLPKLEITAWKGTHWSTKDLSYRLEAHVAVLEHDSWPLTSPLHFYMQWYRGYGESLRTYNRRTNQFRVGVSALF